MKKIKIIFNTFEDAMDFHNTIFIIHREKGVLYYSDFYNLLDNYRCYGWVGYQHKLNSNDISVYGWSELRESSVDYISDDKWALIMPELKQIIF